ncbi:tetratricopeptide repeat protein [Chitinophaga defluvii]|uniref:Tetratricopeptide repeat protein n=1 Tax=Chitinophaga defluvii TaxID=3163343 RepID=A0ABV2T031_9BACT
MIAKAKKEDLLFRNNTGNKSREILVEGFVIRIKEFEQIYNNIKRLGGGNVKLRPNLVIGQRGAGKTTLLYRLKYQIESDQDLKGRLFPIMLTEEQYNLSELVNLWETVASVLEDNFGWIGFYREIEKILTNNAKGYEPLVFDLLDKRLKKEDRNVVLFIENISIFLRKLDQQAREKFKEVFTTNLNFHLLASSTSYFDGYINYEEPPYNYFDITTLAGLSREECEVMLLRIGSQYGAEEDIRYIIENHPGRVEALRRLTGGVPRTISYLFQIFLDNENGKAINDLYILIDTLTFLYKAELDQLSPQQQKVVDVIARKWDAVSVKEITRLTRFESKNVSSILAALEKNQMIEIVRTNTKNHLYRIRERFMNIWYLMRFGRKHDKDSIIWLVRFFDAWCDETELAKRVAAHIDNLKGGEFDVNAAIDMGNTFLSCENVPQELKMLLYKETKSKLPERLAKSFAPGDFIYQKIQSLTEEKKFDQALELLEQVTTKDIQYYRIATWLFLVTGNYSKSVQAAEYVLSFDENDASAALILGIIYEDHIRDIEKAEYYLKNSLQQKTIHPYAASRMGNIAYKYRHDLVEAEQYHRQAIKKNFKSSLIFLGDIFLREKEFDKAQKLYSEAIIAKVESANSKLGILYATINDTKNAKKYFNEAIRLNEKDALINMGIWYRVRRRPNFSKAEFYFKKAIDAGIVKAYCLLGDLYMEELKDARKAIEMFELGVQHKDAESAHQLAHIYSDNKNYEASDEMFEKSLELESGNGVTCFIGSIYASGRANKKEYALHLFKKHLPPFEELDLSDKLLYARILLWNDREEEALHYFQNTYKELSKVITETDNEDKDLSSSVNSVLNQVSNYMFLLIAKERYSACLSLFEESRVDFKTMLRPIYFLLMEYLKKDFPLEYLKAGEELQDTIKELKVVIDLIKKRL